VARNPRHIVGEKGGGQLARRQKRLAISKEKHKKNGKGGEKKRGAQKNICEGESKRKIFAAEGNTSTRTKKHPLSLTCGKRQVW